MALTKIDDRGLKTPIDLLDNEKIRLGTGNDLEIYHNGNHSFLENTTGDLYLRSDDDIFIQVGTGDELAISIENDNAVKLYYDASKKFETTSAGVSVTGTFTASSTVNSGGHFKTNSDWNGFYCGASDDLQIYHDGSNSYISDQGTGELRLLADVFHVKNAANDETLILGGQNGAVSLYNDNSKKLETKSYGVDLTGALVATGDIKAQTDGGKFMSGASDDLKIYHDGNNSKIINETGNLTINATATEAGIDIKPNGAVDLFYDNSKKFETTSTGAILTSGAANTTSVRFGNTANRGLTISTYQSAGNNDSGVVFNAADSENNGYSATLEFDLGGVEFGRFDGNYDSFILASACNGITFNGDYAAANRLNDYEEGTWTGAVMDGNTNGRQNISVNNVVATYRKIGKQVTCWFNITRNETGSRTGQIRFNDSLPFTSASGMNVIVAGSWWLDEGGVSSGDSVGGSVYIVNNSTQGVFVHPTNDSQQAPTRYLEFSQWSNNRPIYGFFTYYVD